MLLQRDKIVYKQHPFADVFIMAHVKVLPERAFQTFHYFNVSGLRWGRYCVDSIATRYGLDSPGFDPQCKQEIFCLQDRSRDALGSLNVDRGCSRGKAAGAWH